MKPTSHPSLRAAAVLTTSLFLTSTVSAIDWDDGADPDEDWSTPANWVGDLVPLDTDDVRIGSFDVVISTPGTTFQQMFLGDPFDAGSGIATLTMTGGDLSGDNIRIGSDNAVTGTGGTGTFNFIDGLVTLDEQVGVQAMEIGRAAGATGTFIMGDGTTSPILTFDNGRFEVGQNGNTTSTFTFRSGTINGTQNFIMGQGNGTGTATATIGGFGTPATFTTTADLNFNNNQLGDLTIDSNGSLSNRALRFSNQNGKSSILTVNSGGTLTSSDFWDDRAGNSIVELFGGTINLTSPSPSLREVEDLTITDGSTLSIALGDASAPLVPLSIAGDDALSVSVTGTVTIEAPVSTFNNSALIDIWTAGSATWDTVSPDQGQWNLGVSPDRLAGGVVAKVIDSPSVAITTDGTTNIVAPTGWTPTVNANDITLTSSAGGVSISPRSALFNDPVADVSVTTDLLVGLGATNAGTLIITDVNSFDVVDDLVIGGAAQGTVTVGTIGGGSSGGMAVTVGDDLVFGDGGTQGGTINLYEGTLTIGGTIIEGTDDPDVQDPSVNNAQLHIDGGTLNVTGNAIGVQRFAIAQAAGTTGSYSQTGGTINHSGTASIGVNGPGSLTVNGTTLDGGNLILAETNPGSATLTMTNSTWTTNGTLEGANAGNSDIILNGTSSIVQTGGDLRVADAGTGTLTLNGSSGLSHSGGNFELAETSSAVGTLTMNTTGTLTCLDNNFILGQQDDSTANLNLIAGTIDLLPSGVSGTVGHMNCNGGDATVTMSGGSILIGEDLLFSSTAAGSVQWNQSAGEVLVNDSLDYRGNGDDNMDLSGTATVKLGQEFARDGNLLMNATANNLFGNTLTLRGSNVTFEVLDGLSSNLTADTDSTLNWEMDDAGLSPIRVFGTVTLNSAAANFTHVGSTPPTGGPLTLIDNQGPNPVSGEFNGFSEGSSFSVSGQIYQISYVGGDGNDVTLTPLTDPVVTIVSDGDVSEGGTASWTITATPAPSGGNIDLDITYSGTADGGDYTPVPTVSILNGQTSASLQVSTSSDGDFEGCETIIASISVNGGSPVSAIVGAPSAHTVSLFDGNVAPTATNLNQGIVDAGSPVDLVDIVVDDPDADYSSKVNTSGEVFYHYSGASNVSSFLDGRPDDDFFFDIDLSGPALSEPAGFSVDIDFTPQVADLTGTVMIWEIGGTSNGSSIHLVNGIPHLLVKCGGGETDIPVDDDANPINGVRDIDWTGNVICIPLGAAGSVEVGIPSRFAVIFDIVGNTVKFSVNGAAESTETLLNNDNLNWRGDHSTANAQISGGIGASNSVGGNPFNSGTIKNFSGGTGAVPCIRFWNESGGSISASGGAADQITATLTLANPADGSISGLSDIGGGSYQVTGDRTTVNSALASAQFVAAAPTYPVVILVSIDDGDEDGSGPNTGTIVINDSTVATVYVDDDFSGPAGTAIADADGGSPVSPATYLTDAFNNLSTALGVVDPNGTVIINDGDYSAENGTVGNNIALRIAGSGGVNSGSNVIVGTTVTGTTNPVDLQGNTVTFASDGGDSTIDGVISGSGGLTQAGSNLVILRAANTFTGTTTITNGTLRLGNFGGVLLGSLDGDGPVVNNSVFDLHPGPGQTITQRGQISGTGLVTCSNDGTVIFDGVAGNTFSGGFELGDGTSSTFDGTDGVVAGFVVVNHNNHLGTGLVRSRGGQLQAGTPGLVIPNDIDIDGGGFRLGGVVDFELAGNVNPIGNANRGYGNYGLDGLDLTISGAINLDDGTMSVEGSNGKDNGSWTFSGPISGLGAVIVQGSLDDGEATFSGANSYEGTTTVAGGTAFFNGNHTPLSPPGGVYTVSNGATLGGIGTIQSVVDVNSNSIFAPGTSVGSIIADWGINFADNSVFAVEVDSSVPSADLLDSNGSVTIGNNVTLDVSDIAGVPQVLSIGQKLTIINYSDFGSTLSGEFAGLPDGTTFSAGVNQFTIDYDDDVTPNTVTLTAAGSANAFSSWVAANYPGLTGGFTGDPDLDGVLSGLEWYFYNSDPTTGGAFGPPLSKPTSTGLGSYTFTHVRPTDRTGLTETYRWTTDLVNFQDSGASDGTNTVTVIPGATSPAGAGYETVTVTVTVTAGPLPEDLFSLLELTN